MATSVLGYCILLHCMIEFVCFWGFRTGDSAPIPLPFPPAPQHAPLVTHSVLLLFAGDNRTLAWPSLSPVPVPLGLSGATIEPGTDHVSCQGDNKVTNGVCEPFCLFNLTADPGEANDLCCGPDAMLVAERLIARLDEEGARGPPNSWTYGTDQKKIKAVLGDICDRAIRQHKNCATIEPFDWNNSAVPAGCHF
jgi:hypothetical protein